MCDPFTSAACVAQIAAGAAAGGPAGAAIGAGAAGQVAGAATSTAVGGLASAIQGGVSTLARDMIAWWVSVPSPNLATDPVPHVISAWLFPFTAAVTLLGIIVAGAKMVITRKSAPLMDVGTGLLTIAITSAVGTLLPALLLKAGDAYSNYVLQSATGGQFGTRFVALLALTNVASPAILIVVGIIALLMAAVQALLLLFRLGAVIILAGTLPLAAAGTMMQATRPWFKKVTGWTLAIIFYKPIGATVYAVGFLLFSGKQYQDVLDGIAVLLLSLVALPAEMRLFNWTVGQLETSTGGGLMSAVIGGAAAVGAVRGYGGGVSVADQARAMGLIGDGAGGGGGNQPPGGPGARPGTGGGSGGGPGPASGSGGGPGGSAAGGGRTPAGAGSGGAGPGGGAGGGPAAPAGAPPPAAGAAGPGAGTAVPAGAAASGTGAAAAAQGAAAAVPPGLVVLGAAQAAQSAASRLADGAGPPGDQR